MSLMHAERGVFAALAQEDLEKQIAHHEETIRYITDNLNAPDFTKEDEDNVAGVRSLYEQELEQMRRKHQIQREMAMCTGLPGMMVS